MSCPVCLNPVTVPALSGTDFLFETTARTFTLHSCSSCRCLFLDPMPDSREIARFYPAEYWWKAAQSGTLKRLESIYRRIALWDHVAFITKAAGNRTGLSILDVGCGSGTLVGVRKQRGLHGKGVDFSAEAAKMSKVENGAEGPVGSLATGGFPDQAFALVTSCH